MRRITYHIIRIIPLLALTAVAAWIILDKWHDGKTVRALVQGAASLIALYAFARWLYRGHFQPKPVSRFILRYMQWRLFKRDVLPFMSGIIIATACTVGFLAVKKPDIIRDPMFWLIMGGFIIVLALFKSVLSYIKYCYTHD